MIGGKPGARFPFRQNGSRAATRMALDAAMRRLREIFILAALLVGAVGFVLWYVARRKSEQRARPSAPRVVGPVIDSPKIDLTKIDGQTLDLSSGRPVVRDSAEDRAAIEKALHDIEAATRGVQFGPDDGGPNKKAEPAAPPPKN